MKKLLLVPILLLTTFFSGLKAQDFLGIRQSNYSGIMGADLNPASIADNRFVVDVTLGGLSLYSYNNYLSYNATTMPAWWTRAFQDTANSWHPNNDSEFFDNNFTRASNNKLRKARVTSNIDILNFMFSLKGGKIGIGAGMKIRSYTDISNASDELILLSENGLDFPDLWNTSLDDQNLNISSLSWAEYFVNYAQVVMDNDEHFMKVGGKLKFLQGMAGAYLYTDDLSYNLQNQDTAISIQGNVQYGYSSNLQGYFDGVEVTPSEIYQLRSKLGLGVDLGVIYEWRPDWEEYKYEMDGVKNIWRKDKNKYKIRAGFSILDIGGMRFQKGDLTRNFIFDETNLDLGIFDPVEDPASLDSVLQANFSQLDDESTFYMNLPTTMSAQVDYHIWNDFYVNLSGFWALSMKKQPHKVSGMSLIALTPRYDFAWAGVSVPVSYGGIPGFRTGLGLRLGPLTFGTSDLRTLFAAGNMRGADFYAALRVPILYGHPSDVDNDKVSDKLDICPDVPGIWDFKGCPDTDGDGIQDSEDVCPNEPGLPEFNGCPDRDGDGVPDKDDYCPDDPGPKELNGCPDTDGDGILDKDDKCPELAGVEEHDGCPDTDGDGLIDPDDLCPNDPGPLANQGCPDTDKDGIFDYLDDCPTEAGPEENRGCPWPDTDGDGLLDKDDKCPYVAGPVENEGCPYTDTDGDGVPDIEDECVMTPGPVENKGCPEVDEKEEEILKTAFDNLQFESAKAVIKQESYASLNDLADLLIRKDGWKLKIAGHTDNVGKEQNNLILSKKRAEAVRDFMEQRGVAKERMIVQYFGQTQPIESNDTSEGRAKNRRVEMTLIFE